MVGINSAGAERGMWLAGTVLLGLAIACGPAAAPRPAANPTGTSEGGLADMFADPVGTIGATCIENDACTSGLCDRTVPGGACTAHCDAQTPCADGGTCFEGTCFAACTTSRQCRATFVCLAPADAAQGLCAWDLSLAPTDSTVGAPCTAAVECGAAEGLEPYCAPEVGFRGEATGFAGGMCLGIGCNDATPCGANEVCIADAPVPFCLPSCATGTDCRDGYVCNAETNACMPAQSP